MMKRLAFLFAATLAASAFGAEFDSGLGFKATIPDSWSPVTPKNATEESAAAFAKRIPQSLGKERAAALQEALKDGGIVLIYCPPFEPGRNDNVSIGLVDGTVPDGGDKLKNRREYEQSYAQTLGRDNFKFTAYEELKLKGMNALKLEYNGASPNSHQIQYILQWTPDKLMTFTLVYTDGGESKIKDFKALVDSAKRTDGKTFAK
jgi:hypothetical protein